ncbi:TauD/TfdA dioxygenase family protein [Actinophytocola sp.]|uniref:TauD/TfdA dioxygenase family protein n=1 Tax=Actinophytocola sp. TaxID=1872138 RepID=UPI002D8092FC|nr:TauD/TfdA family dioxygenase [Actinophytocola sp.]HET9138076.1 TauD/TfdA family dioxygenase [Actinophytocola sp.]
MTGTLSRAEVEIRRLAGNIGAVVTGVDAGGPLTDETIAMLRNAILDHKVVFLRGQRLDYDGLVAFGRRFGSLTLGHPIYGGPEGKPLLREVDSRSGTIRANHWHTDFTYMEAPPAFAFLNNKVCPPVGGDTIWANTAVGYANLPAELRDLADALRVVHSNNSDFTDDTYDGDLHQNFVEHVFETEHPAVRVHPETGERSLLLGGFARRVVGMSPQAGRDLIRVLLEYATKPEHTVRWQWQVDDLAIWDNRSTLHYAIYDYGDEHRRGERVTVTGTAPVGVDGRPSAVLRGDTTAFRTGTAA